ncbi:hypothetical protein HYV49_06075 [Candidatus Pacearchaeota archaeon]|nr:hypothetical protein [Candidatus Pacearchaeota archaeon]
MANKMTLEKAIENIESKLKSLSWKKREIREPNITMKHGGNVRLHQFTALDRSKQIFVYRTIIRYPDMTYDPDCGYFGGAQEYTVPAHTETSYGMAVLQARRTMADFFEPEGIIIWEGTFADPESEGLIAHFQLDNYEEYDLEIESKPEDKIRLLYNKLNRFRTHKNFGKTKNERQRKIFY